MTTATIIIIGVLALAALWGFHKGIVGQVGAIAGLFIGVIACRLLGPAVMQHFPIEDVTESFPRHYLQLMAVYAGIYIGSYLVVTVATKLLRFVVKKLSLGLLDSLAGALVGIAVWGVPLSLALNLGALLWPGHALFDGSNAVVEAVRAFAPWLFGLISPSK